MSVWLSELLLRSQSDERLLGLARAGDDRAFATIVERYRPELLILARRLNSDGRAEDVLQQAFLSAFVSLRSGTEVGHLRGWLYQIVRNAATKLRPPHDLPLDDVVVSGEPLEDIVQRRARALSAVTELSRLPERQRDALVAIALNGLPRADVALTMGVSEGALRQLVHRARTTLRGAATAVTPWPLARWLAASPASGTDVAAAAGMVSAGGVGAKVSALLATGVLATTIGVVPPPNHGPSPSPRHHLTGLRNAGPDRVARVFSSAGAGRGSRLVSGTSRSDGLANRSHPERQTARPRSSSANAIPHRHLETGRAGVAGVGAARRIDGASRPDDTNSGAADTDGGPGGLTSPNPGSGRHGDGGAPGRGSVTSSDQDGSASSGASTQGAAASSQSDRGGSDGENVQSHDGSGSSAAAALDGPGLSPGSGQDGEGDGGTSGSGSGGSGHGDSSSSGGSTDTETTPDR
jgi:RNA polymerase sigma factor (sigma-70 family)